MSTPAEPQPLADFRFCARCGHELEMRERGGRARPTCPNCGYVVFRNPAVGVAVIIRDVEGRVLLGRRRGGAYAGQWCIPCGYVEWEEEVRAAAVREFLEETGLRVRLGPVYAVHSNFHNAAQHTVGVWFSGEVEGGTLAAGDDLDDARYFALGEVPEEMAFPTDRLVLDQLLLDQDARAD